MFVVCPRPMFIPAWVGTSGDACQTRRKAASITILPSRGRWQREQETRGGRKERTSTHWVQLLSIEETIKLWEEKRAVCILIKPCDLTVLRCLDAPQQSQEASEMREGKCAAGCVCWEMQEPCLAAGQASGCCTRQPHPAAALNLKKGAHSPHHFN